MDYCSECTYLRENDYKGNCNGLFYCERRYDYVYGNNPKCGSFCRAYSRSDYKIKDISIKGEQEQNYSSGCYLTTMVSSILGFSDKGYVLSQLRKFRNNVLQNNLDYKELLVQYDIIGPKIAEQLYLDPNKNIVANGLYQNILLKVVKEIELGNIDIAVRLYKGMTYGLQVCYGLAEQKIDPAFIQSSNIKESGHGKVKVK